MSDLGFDNGWTASAPVWLLAIGEEGDPARVQLLDPVMLELAADVRGLRVLDLGCGEGRFSRMLAARGASPVGLDLVRTMLAAARERSGGAQHLVRATGDVLPFRDDAFDLVVSYLTLVDITDFRTAIRESARVLRPGGRLLVANLSFVTASEGWARDEQGRRLYHRVDRYLEEREQIYEWYGLRIRNWHRPLSAYMTAYLGAGFALRRFIEPMPDDDTLRADPYFEDWYRVSDFTVMLWQKSV
jgi:SAM-dependent methyltransferase